MLNYILEFSERERKREIFSLKVNLCFRLHLQKATLHDTQCLLRFIMSAAI